MGTLASAVLAAALVVAPMAGPPAEGPPAGAPPAGAPPAGGPLALRVAAPAVSRAATAVAAAISTTAAPAPGPWQWPLAPRPRVVRGFEPPPERWASGHRGIDLTGSVGQQVLAAGGGTIGFVGVIAGTPVVTVVHGLLRTTYEPVVSTLRRGEAVGAGEPIGRLVLSGSHCAPRACLHWGLRRGRAYLDPLSLLGRGRVRLLPLSGAGPPPIAVPGLDEPGG